MWIFDKEIGIKNAPRWLKERSGHADPPHIIHFYGDSGNQLLSCSKSTHLRYNSLIKEFQSVNFASENQLAKRTINKSGKDIGLTKDIGFAEI